jgi:hypothetical protein
MPGRLLAWFLLVVAWSGCQSAPDPFAPSNNRNWSPDQAVVPTAKFKGDAVTVQNVRYCKYFDTSTYVVDYNDRTYDLNQIRGVDFLMVPFPVAPALAHTMLSFEFENDSGERDHVVVSVETRKEVGERYSPLAGSARQFELIYVVADERDAVQLRTNFRNDQVYLYRTVATPKSARKLFVDVMQRANKLAKEPEFYDTITNNCTTNIAAHINRLQPDRVLYDWRILLPGYSDRKAYEAGLLATQLPFEQAQANAKITAKAQLAAGRDDFSERIRR